MVARTNGTVHGRNITLDEDPGLPDGARVSVQAETISTGDDEMWRQFERAVGAWKDDPSIVEVFDEIEKERFTRMPRDVEF